jgi:menaquinone-dependent protoporphyrinogen oxidase
MRILVSPASKHGGTAEIGRAIAKVLRQRGIDVDVTQPEDIRDLSHYDGFILGSALYMGSWLPEAVTFVDEHAEGLKRLPTWLFSSGPLGDARPEEPIRPELVQHLVSATNALEHRLFSGRLDLERLGRTERFIARWVGAANGDYREWDEIAEWVHKIAACLDPSAGETEGLTT